MIRVEFSIGTIPQTTSTAGAGWALKRDSNHDALHSDGFHHSADAQPSPTATPHPQSVLQQQEVELEVIVVDDGSTDELRGTVHELKILGSACFVRNRRRASAWRGIGASPRRVGAGSRSWTTTICGHRTSCVTQVRAAEDQGRGWAYAGSVNVSEDLRLLGGAPPADPEEVVRALPRTNLIPGGCSGVVVRRDLLPSNPFDPSYRHLEDWDLWIRLSRLDRPVGVSAPLVGYRIHGSNKSLDTVGLIAELDIIEARYGGPIDRARFYRHLARVSLRASRHRDGLRYYCQAAARDRQYRNGDFVPDLIEMAQGHGSQRSTSSDSGHHRQCSA